MSLDNFYSLRKDFIILGLTGKMQAGADKFVNILTKDNFSCDDKCFINSFQNIYSRISESETRKVRRISDFFNYSDNWIKFDVIEYKYVILLFLLHKSYDKDKSVYIDNLCNNIINLGKNGKFVNPRFGMEHKDFPENTEFINNDFRDFLDKNIDDIKLVDFNFTTLISKLKNDESDFFFSDNYQSFAKKFFNCLDGYSIYLRHTLVHDLTLKLRTNGNLNTITTNSSNSIVPTNQIETLEHIYSVAHVINRLIKIHRKKKEDKAHIIIDRLKNSYEMMYFREKYSGFYMVASNRKENERLLDVENKIDNLKPKTGVKQNIKYINILDNAEYKVSDFKEGSFASCDVENCVQKADYHIWFENEFESFDKYDFDKIKKLDKTNPYYVYQPYLLQVLKLVGLIQQPGLITPTYPERIMQIAFNAKLNSGCISRQVGAVVTDKNFSVKGIGWNDVPVGQVPCSHRDLRDFELSDRVEFTNFERGMTEHKYSDGKTFNTKLSNDFSIIKATVNDDLKGRPCSYCFKSFHNTYEAKENQVHTRSLHAEENAMMQISKYGGQGLQGGNLFTTASPCELCAKKAYQLGIKNIFYIELYPGISKNHILEGGKNNPTMYQFQGVLGRSYQKLYEPFMAIKDETALRTNLKPSENTKDKAKQIQKIIHSTIKDKENEFKELQTYLDGFKDKPQILQEIANLLKEGVEYRKNLNNVTPN